VVWYLRVHWRHDFPDEPVFLYSEVGEDGYEIRKDQSFRDGRLDWADESRETSLTGLGELPIGKVQEIAAEEEFTPQVIDRQEFEAVWQRAKGMS
jgi:hypothetical protein